MATSSPSPVSNANDPTVDLTKLVSELATTEAVPYLAALRYTPDGLRKHAEWIRTWELQRAEDRGEDVGSIPVPPKYTGKDFRGHAWDHRGKLDVPKERFISYPLAERGTDTSPVLGWAGWDHLARARALAAWIVAAERDGATTETLTPLLAGLAELVPWLMQWHNDTTGDSQTDRAGDRIAALVEQKTRALGLTADDLTEWAPPAATRGRRKQA